MNRRSILAGGLGLISALLLVVGTFEDLRSAQTSTASPLPVRLPPVLGPDSLLNQWRSFLLPAGNLQPVRRAVSANTENTFSLRSPIAANSAASLINGSTAIMRTLAGGSADGAPALGSTLDQPYDAAIAPDGSIAIVDTYNNRIRKFDLQTGLVTNIAGTSDEGFAGDGGPATQASMNFPMMAAYGSDGSLYFTDTWNDRIRRVDPQTGIITTVAGNGPTPDAECLTSNSGDGGPATSSAVCAPHGVTVDASGNLYIAETEENDIRRVDAQTGIITTVAGNRSSTPTGDGSPATGVAIIHPWGIVTDSLGNPIVTNDDGQYRVQYINLLNHAVTIYPSGPQPLTVQPNAVVTIAGGNGYALQGTEGDGGAATGAALDLTKSLKVAPNGDLLLTEDGSAWDGTRFYYAMSVRRINWQTGIINTIAGNQTLGAGPDNVPATQSALSYPEAALVDGNGNVVVVDRGNSRLRKISAADGTIATSAGGDLDAPMLAQRGQIYKPTGVADGPRGIYFTDPFNLRIRRVTTDGVMSTLAGSSRRPCVRFGVAFDGQCEGDGLGGDGDGGPASDALFYVGALYNLSVSPTNLVTVVSNAKIRAINDSDQPITLFPQSAHPLTIQPGYIDAIAGGGATPVPDSGSIDSRDARLQDPRDVTFAPNGDFIIAERLSYRILRVDAKTAQVSVIAGIQANNVCGPDGICVEQPESYADGPIAIARFLSPYSVAAAPDGTTFYVADTGNHRIRKIDTTLGVVTTIAGTGVEGFSGDGMPAILAELSLPSSIRVAADGSILFMDFGNQRIRKIGTDGNISTVAGNGPTLITPTASAMCADMSAAPCGHYSGDGGDATSAEINLPLNLAVRNNSLFIADTANSRIRRVDFGVPLLNVLSRKTHGLAGPFDIDVTNGGIECRSGGASGTYTIVFRFENPLSSVDGANVTSGAATVGSSQIGSDPREYVVNLSGVTNAQAIAVNLTNVQDTLGNVSATVSGTVNLLIGDTNADGFVNSADISQTKAQSGQPVTSANFREDTNGDGFINSADISLVKSRSGTALP